MPLVAAAPGLWTLDHDLRLAGVRLGTRMSVLRAGDGGLWLHSPVPIDDAVAAALNALGPVRGLVAPNLLHHLYLGAAAARWPAARVYGAPGLGQKVKGLPALTDLPAAGELAPGLRVLRIEGAPDIGEHLLLHGESATLLLTDLCFHFVEVDHWWTRTFMGLNDAYGRLTMSRLGKTMVKDKVALRASVDAALALPFSRIGLCHGRPIDAEGPARLREAFAWLQ